MTFALGQSVIDRNPHDKAKRGIVGKVIDHGFHNHLVYVEWPDGSRSWIIATRLQHAGKETAHV